MTAWSLLFVPASLGLIVVLLAAVSWIEQRVLSPRALIVHTATAKHAAPDQVEAFVAAQAKGVLDGLALRPAPPDVALVDGRVETQDA